MKSSVDIQLERKKNSVVLGEAGSGKTEFAIAIARRLKSEKQKVSLFDMDQTKPLYRLRNVAAYLEAEGIEVFCGEEFMDSPLVPAGLESALADQHRRIVLDVGGGKSGTLCLGQYRDLLLEKNTQVFYIINPYRSFSRSEEAIARTMGEILSLIGKTNPQIICNPYCGLETDADTVEQGLQMVDKMLKPLKLHWEAFMLPERLWEKMESRREQAVAIHSWMSRVLDLN